MKLMKRSQSVNNYVLCITDHSKNIKEDLRLWRVNVTFKANNKLVQVHKSRMKKYLE